MHSYTFCITACMPGGIRRKAIGWCGNYWDAIDLGLNYFPRALRITARKLP